MNFQTMHKQRKIILVLAAAGAISVFLPWFTISAEGFGVRVSESQSGLHGTGMLVELTFIAAGILALLGNQTRPLDSKIWTATICAGAIAFLFVGVNLIRTLGTGDGFGFAQAGPGFGIWISLLTSAGMLAVAWLLRTPGDTVKGGFDSLRQSLSNFSATATPTGTLTGTRNNASLNGTESRSRKDDPERPVER